MKKKMLAVITAFMLLILVTTPAFATSKKYSLDRVDLDVEIPEEYATLTRDMDKSDPTLKTFGYDSPAKLNEEFGKNGIYLNTSPLDGEFGITIAVAENKISNAIFNLSTYKEKIIQKTVNLAKKELDKQINLKDSKIYKNKTATFVVFSGTVNKNGLMYLTQYYTIYNGKQYTFNLYSYDKEPTKEAIDVQKNIVDSIKFTKTLKKPFSILSPTGIPTLDKAIRYIVIIFISLGVFFIVRNKKRFKPPQQSTTRYSDRLK